MAKGKDEQSRDEAEGEFIIAKPKIAIDGGDATEPAFRQVRTTTLPIDDNSIVVAFTILGLGALIGSFLLINQNIPPPPY